MNVLIEIILEFCKVWAGYKPTHFGSNCYNNSLNEISFGLEQWSLNCGQQPLEGPGHSCRGSVVLSVVPAMDSLVFSLMFKNKCLKCNTIFRTR